MAPKQLGDVDRLGPDFRLPEKITVVPGETVWQGFDTPKSVWAKKWPKVLPKKIYVGKKYRPNCVKRPNRSKLGRFKSH